MHGDKTMELLNNKYHLINDSLEVEIRAQSEKLAELANELDRKNSRKNTVNQGIEVYNKAIADFIAIHNEQETILSRQAG